MTRKKVVDGTVYVPSGDGTGDWIAFLDVSDLPDPEPEEVPE